MKAKFRAFGKVRDGEVLRVTAKRIQIAEWRGPVTRYGQSIHEAKWYKRVATEAELHQGYKGAGKAVLVLEPGEVVPAHGRPALAEHQRKLQWRSRVEALMTEHTALPLSEYEDALDGWEDREPERFVAWYIEKYDLMDVAEGDGWTPEKGIHIKIIRLDQGKDPDTGRQL